MDDFGNIRISLQSPSPEDNAGAAYQQVADNRAGKELTDWLSSVANDAAPAPAAKAAPAGGSGNADLDTLMNGGSQPAPAAAVEGVDKGAAPAADVPNQTPAAQLLGGKVSPIPAQGVDEVFKWAKSLGADLGGGAVEAPKQVVGGVIDALGEVDQFMQQAVPIGGMQLWDKDGNFDPSMISSAQMQDNEKAKTDLFSMMSPAEANTVTGGLVRSTAQFLTGFIPALEVTKGLQAVKYGVAMSNAAAGAIADMVVFDPNQDRLSTYLNQIPALASIVPDYLADNSPDQSHWEGRLKNAIEGAGLGLATEGLLGAFRYYKANSAARAADKAASNPVGATVEAAKDELKQAARRELVQDIPDEALRPLGDASPDAPLIVQAPAGINAGEAMTRLSDARTRAAQADKDFAALTQVNDIRERFATAKGVPAGSGRDVMDDMLDELRSGAVSNAAIPKRPVADIVKGLGGVDPTSSLAAELRGNGITAKTFPGLFRRDGVKSLDNVPASEHPIFAGRSTNDAAGYLDQQSFIDGLKAEADGKPLLSPEHQKRFDDIISPLDDLDKTLDHLGIDYRTMSNDRVKQRMQEIDDATAIANRETGQDALFSSPRSLEDIQKQAREEATAKGLDPEAAAADAIAPKVYINHARINSAEDVRQTLQAMADLDAGNIADKSRGVVSNQQTIKESSSEYRDLNDLIGRPPGPMSAAQAVAARRILTSSGEQIVQLAKIAEGPTASAADLYNFRRAMSVHYAIQSEVLAARSETARALQSWQIPAGATKARSQAIADLLANGGGAGDMQALAKAVSNVADNPTALNTMAQELGRGRFGKALYQVWINGLLSSPKTHLANIMSNSITSLWAIPERYMAAGISKAFYNGEIQTGEAAAQAFGLVQGIRDATRLVYMGNRAEGHAGVGDVFDAFSKIDGTTQNNFSASALGLDPAGGLGWGIDMMSKLVNAPGSALNAEDKFFKTINYRMELHAQAYRTASSEGLEGEDFAKRVADVLASPPDNLKAEALDMAAYQTFTNPLGGGARQMLGGIQKTPLLGPIFRVVVPFVKTPTNIMKYAFSRTPLAYMSGSIRSDIAAGGARAAQAHARVAMGSMLMLTMMDMTSEGTITGSGPLGKTDQETRAMRGYASDLGVPPYSVKIGGKYYSYSRADPIGMMMGLAADMSETFSNAGETDGNELAAAGITALASNLASKTYMTGIYDFIGAIDPRNPSSSPGKYISDFATGLVPYSSFLRNVTSAVDPTARDAKALEYGEDGKIDPVATYLQSMVNKVKKGIPGLSDELPPMRDLWGEPISRSSGMGWGWDFVSPIASKTEKPDAVTQTLLDNRIAVGFPPRQIQGVQLTPQEYDQFSELAGKGAKTYLDQLTASPGFSKMSAGPDGMKADIIKNVISNFRDQAAQQMIQRHPDLRDRAISIQQKNMKSLTGQ